jgi:hypothetical protein
MSFYLYFLISVYFGDDNLLYFIKFAGKNSLLMKHATSGFTFSRMFLVTISLPEDNHISTIRR